MRAASCLALLLLASATEPTPALAQPVPLTLEESIEIGVRNATLVLKSESDHRLAGKQVLQGYGQFLPTLDVGASYGVTGGKTLYTLSSVSLVDQRALNTTLSVSSALNLFNGLSDWAGLKSALARDEASLSSLDWARQQVALDITQSFLQVVLDRQLLEIAVKNLQASRARLELFEGRASVGSASPADLYRQRAQTSADELFTRSYEARLNDDQALLVRKLRVDPAKEYSVAEPSMKPAPPKAAQASLELAIQTALSNRADVRSFASRAEASDWDVRRAKGGYLPKLDLNFVWLQAGRQLTRQIVNGQNMLPPDQPSTFSQLGSQPTYAVTLGLSWNLFDRFLTTLDVARTQNALDYAKIDSDDARLQVVADVKIAHSEYRIAERQIQTARVGVEAAQKAYDAITGRYRVGSASFIDVLASQATLVQAQSSQAQAMINLKLRERALEYAVGELRY